MSHGTPDGSRRRDGGAETTYYVLGERHLGDAVAADAPVETDLSAAIVDAL